MANIGDLVATATLDIAPFMSNTKNLKTHMKSLDSSLKAVENSFKGTGNKLNGLKAIYSQTGRSLSGYQTLLSKQSAHYNKLKAEIGDVNTATAQQKTQLVNAQSAMTSTAAKVAELQTKYNSLAKEIAIQSSVFTKFGNGLQTVGGKLQTVGDKAQSVGSSLTKGLTTPIVAGAGLAVKAAVDYESAFAGVRKTVDASEAGYRKLSDGIRQMAKELPTSAAEIAHVAETAGQLGIKQNDILGFTRTMIDMGESTNLSADEAATAIAKIGNILGLTSADYSRFGSSVVALGNNFATTEKDVVEMTNRLAASGKLAGLTAPEILGLATAMSSVGIEAEAGGTAMSQTLTQIGAAVDAGGDKLNKLAEIAGMSAEQFASKWKEKPIEAVEAFIKGLGNLGEEGENASSVLDELGMSGIRQSNMLKSLGLASDKVSGAVKMSTEAWKENSALSEEAAKRYETTQSKLQILKNKATDVAIELGGPLAEALTDAMEAGEPLIRSIADLAKKFSSLDKEQQQQIIKWGLIAAAAGPALSIFGKGISTLGSVATGIGKISSGIGKLSGAFSVLKNGSAVIEGAGVAAAGGATKVGLLTSAVGLLGNPVTWGVLLGGAAVAAISVYAQKVNDAKERTDTWGTSVSAVQANELTKMKTTVDEVTKSMEGFSGTAGGVDEVTSSFGKLNDEIQKLIDKNLDESLKLAEKLGFSEEQTQKIKDRAAENKKVISDMSNDAIEIYQNAASQHRQLSAEEKTIVRSIQDSMIKEQLSQLNYSKKEQKAILKAMNGETSQLTQKQAKDMLATTKKWIEDENKAYESSKKGLKKMLDQKRLTQEEYNQAMETLNMDHQAKIEAYGEKYMNLQKKVLEGTTLPIESQKAVFKNIEKTMNELGLSYDEFQNKMSGMAEKAAESSSKVKTYWKGMSDEARTAVDSWNSIVLDPITGKVKTNATEEVAKAIQAEGGWDAMKFNLKHADLSSNARMTVGEALVQTGMWDSLTPEEKELVINGDKGMESILNSTEKMNTWNSLDPKVKDLLADDSDFMGKAGVAEQTLNNWNGLTPEIKKLLADNAGAIGSAKEANSMMERWNSLSPEAKELLATDLASPKAEVAKAAIDLLQGKNVKLEATDNTALGVATAKTELDSVKQSKPADINATDKTNPPAITAGLTINGVKQKAPANINASDKTGGPASTANRSVNSVKQNSPTSIKAVDNASGVADGVIGKLAQIPRNIYTKITTVYEDIKKKIGFKDGTNYHLGGPAIVNDQKGPVYKELVTLPNGVSFIPEGRDVMLPLPRGSKVLKASDTKKLFPHYANGIGFENTNIASLAQRMGVVNSDIVVNTEQDKQRSDDIYRLMSELLDVMKSSKDDRFIAQALDIAEQSLDRPVNLYLQDGSWMGRVADRLTSIQTNKALISNRMKGEF